MGLTITHSSYTIHELISVDMNLSHMYTHTHTQTQNTHTQLCTHKTIIHPSNDVVPQYNIIIDYQNKSKVNMINK